MGLGNCLSYAVIATAQVELIAPNVMALAWSDAKTVKVKEKRFVSIAMGGELKYATIVMERVKKSATCVGVQDERNARIVMEKAMKRVRGVGEKDMIPGAARALVAMVLVA